MTKNSGSGGGSVGVGISSVLMIFIALCLTVFSVLSYLSARADYKLAEKAASATTAYYEADSKAEHIYAGLSSASANELESAAAKYGAEISDRDGATYIIFDVPADKVRTLHVELLLQSDGSLSREVWKIVTSGEETDESVGVLQDFSFLG